MKAARAARLGISWNQDEFHLHVLTMALGLE